MAAGLFVNVVYYAALRLLDEDDLAVRLQTRMEQFVVGAEGGPYPSDSI
jgi:hypothetical protein